MALGGLLYKPKWSNAREGKDQTDIITNMCNRTVYNHPNTSLSISGWHIFIARCDPGKI